MNTKFCLIIKYESGECAHITEKPELIEALEEYKEMLLAQQAQLSFKCYALPKILEAKLVRVVG